MNIRHKALGFVAAAGLALSFTGQVIAQDADDTGTTTVELLEGGCTGSIESAIVDFGTYTYDGEDFISNGDGTGTTFTLTATDNTLAQLGCDVELVASTLRATGVDPEISVTLNATASTIVVPVAGGASVSVNAFISLSLSNLPPGTYTGTILVTGSSSGG